MERDNLPGRIGTVLNDEFASLPQAAAFHYVLVSLHDFWSSVAKLDYLRRHGKPAVRLPDTAVPLIPGDLIDLGKGLFIHLEGTP